MIPAVEFVDGLVAEALAPHIEVERFEVSPVEAEWFPAWILRDPISGLIAAFSVYGERTVGMTLSNEVEVRMDVFSTEFRALVSAFGKKTFYVHEIVLRKRWWNSDLVWTDQDTFVLGINRSRIADWAERHGCACVAVWQALPFYDEWDPETEMRFFEGLPTTNPNIDEQGFYVYR